MFSNSIRTPAWTIHRPYWSSTSHKLTEEVVRLSLHVAVLTYAHRFASVSENIYYAMQRDRRSRRSEGSAASLLQPATVKPFSNILSYMKSLQWRNVLGEPDFSARQFMANKWSRPTFHQDWRISAIFSVSASYFTAWR